MLNRPSGVRNLALRSLRPASGDGVSGHPPDVFRQRIEALSARLTPLVGPEGYRALLVRALSRAKADLPWLRGVEVDEMGSLAGLEEVLSTQEPAAAEAGCVAVLAYLLALLASLVGVELTRQLVSGAWPDVSVSLADVGMEEDQR